MVLYFVASLGSLGRPCRGPVAEDGMKLLRDVRWEEGHAELEIGMQITAIYSNEPMDSVKTIIFRRTIKDQRFINKYTLRSS